MPVRKILLVEDEYILALDLERQLTELGYKVIGFVASGEEAVALAHEHKPDLILMDIKIKGEIDGIEAARQIQERDAIPVIYITAYSDRLFLDRAKITEPFGYLVKPVNRRELSANIEMALYRHAMEQKLKANEAWLSNILASLGEGVIATDAKGIVQFMNRTAERLCEWDSQKAVGKPLQEVFSLRTEKQGPFHFNFEEILQRENPFEFSENAMIPCQSGPRFVEGRIAPIVDVKGNRIGLVCVFRDVTAFRQMQIQVQNLERYQIFSQISSGVAHEVRNPLNAILSITEAMAQELGDKPEFKEYLTHIRMQVDRLSLLMKDLLDLGRPIQPSSMQTQDLVHLCEAGIRLWEQSTSHNDQKIIKNFSESSLYVHVNGSKIQQVLFNLLENAAQHNPPQGEIQVVLNRRDDHAVILIIDRGTGIPEENLSKIFDPFFTTTRTGIGLGLSIVKNIVEQHHGTILLRNNTPSPGCTAELRLPLVNPVEVHEG